MVVNKDGYLADYMDDTGRRAARTGKIESWMPGDRTLTVAVTKTPASMDYPAVLPTLSVNEELLNAWPAMEVEQETPDKGGHGRSILVWTCSGDMLWTRSTEASRRR